jgi:Phage integrase, N-terminal SAM-like domain
VNDVDAIGILSGHKEVLMTRLRKMMLEELERRNYSEATTRCYIRTVEDFSRRFKRSPDRLGPEHIREYQAELFKKRKLSPGTVTQRDALPEKSISTFLRSSAGKKSRDSSTQL